MFEYHNRAAGNASTEDSAQNYAEVDDMDEMFCATVAELLRPLDETDFLAETQHYPDSNMLGSLQHMEQAPSGSYCGYDFLNHQSRWNNVIGEPDPVPGYFGLGFSDLVWENSQKKHTNL